MSAPEVLRVVVASPSDVATERKRLDDVVAELNEGVAADNGFRLELARWEKDAFPGFHPAGPQGLIDPILRIEDCDLFIGIFWRRFGTAVADAGSGTEHEFRKAFESWKTTRRPEILFYFKNKPVSPRSSAEVEQLSQVIAFKENFPVEGLSWEFGSPAEFEKLVRLHVARVVRQLRSGGDARAVVASDAAHDAAAPKVNRINYSGLDFEEILSNEDDDELFSIAFSRDGTIAAGSSRKIFLWDQDARTDPRTFEHDSYVYSVCFSHDGRWLASGGEDGTVRVYDVATGAPRWPPRLHGEAVYSVAFSRDGALLASGGYDRAVNLWNADTGRRRNRLVRRGRVTSVAFSPTAPVMAIGDLDDTVTLWEFERNRDQELSGHTSSVETVAFSPDGRLLASGGLDKVVRVWDASTGEPAWPEPGRGHEYLIRSVAFSPDGLTLASASWDKTLRLWDVETGGCNDELPWDELKDEHRWHSDWIWSVAFSQNGLLLATGGSDGKIVLLSIPDGSERTDGDG